jgi:hypothetical protein
MRWPTGQPIGVRGGATGVWASTLNSRAQSAALCAIGPTLSQDGASG